MSPHAHRGKFGALKPPLPGDFIADDFRKILEAQGFLCFYCGSPIVCGSLHPDFEAVPDHLLAQSRGGVDSAYNIVAACNVCIQLKGAKLPGEFLRERWIFAQPVGNPAQKSTTIPLYKKRGYFSQPANEPEEDEDGNIVTAHLEVAPIVASMVRSLSDARSMRRAEAESTAMRPQTLLDQAKQMQRRFQEDAGQMSLPFDKPKPVASIAEALGKDEAQALLVAKGLAIANALRRQA